MKRMSFAAALSAVAVLASTGAALAANPQIVAAVSSDQPGATDSPLTGRYKGAALILQTHKAFDEIVLAAGTSIGADYSSTKHFAKTLTVQGEVTRSIYVSPQGRSTLEVVKNYRDALVAKGFTPAYECAGAACGPSFRKLKYAWDNKATQVAGPNLDHPRQGLVQAVFDGGKDLRYSLLRKGGTYVALFGALNAGGGYGDASEALNDRVSVLVEVVQPKEMEHNILVVDSSAIGQSMAAEGAVNIYGLYFATDKAELLPSSTPQLAEIAKYLKANPAVQVFVVGHTDMQGAFEHNLALADARAKSVAGSLAQAYGVPAARMVARGVGPLAPVASNRTDAGRAKNRRVQLVLR